MLQGAYAVKRIRKLLPFFKILLLGWSWTNEFGGGSGLLPWNLPAFVGQLHPDDLICLRCFVDRGPDGFDAQLPRNWADLFDTEALRRSLAPTGSSVGLIRSDKILLLFGPETRPAAVDFESKFHESGLANVQITLEWVEGGSAESLWHHTSALLAKAKMTSVRVVASLRSADKRFPACISHLCPIALRFVAQFQTNDHEPD
jgi:hypothetical protein